jgi:sugar phosphate permease
MASIPKLPYRYRVGILLYFLILITYLDRVTISLVGVHFGWRAPFFVNAVLGLVWVLICYRWFRNEPAEMKGISPQERELIETNRRFVSHHRPFPWKTAFSKPLV